MKKNARGTRDFIVSTAHLLRHVVRIRFGLTHG